LDHKYKTIFKSKRNWKKLIDGWDVKIEKKLREKKLREFILVSPILTNTNHWLHLLVL
jgi:hypothetical protein